MRQSKYDTTALMQSAKGQSTNSNDSINVIEQRVEFSTEMENLREGIQGVRQLIIELNEAKVIALETIQELRQASNALSAATASADNVIDGVCKAICRAERTVVTVKLHTSDKDVLANHRLTFLADEKELLINHQKDMKAMLGEHFKDVQRFANKQSGFYFTGWFAKFMAISYLVLYIACAIIVFILIA